jgi:hypothetical protein
VRSIILSSLSIPAERKISANNIHPPNNIHDYEDFSVKYKKNVTYGGWMESIGE